MRKTSLEKIADLIGDEKAILLAQSIPQTSRGLWLYVPRFPDNSHPIAKLIGYDNMQKVCDEMGGEQRRIEKPERFKRRQLARQMLADPCLSITAIAEACGYSRQHLYAMWG